jgi:hypothetical protein
VTSVQRRGEPWNCTWCNAANQGFTSRNDPAAATLGDLAADMASHRLEFKRRQSEEEQQPRDTVPVLIVTTNEVPGYRSTRVHGDVFGLIVRARNYFSNVGAQQHSREPFPSWLCFAGLQYVGGLGELTGAPGGGRSRPTRSSASPPLA